MNISEQINADIKSAMLAKEKEKLEALRAIKSAILLLSTSGGSGQVSNEEIIKSIQKLSKQRKETATLYQTQGREDLAKVELFQAEIIDMYLPKQMSEAEIRSAVKSIIEKVGAVSPADLGKVMGIATKELTGKADGKIISTIAKELLS